MNYLIYNDDNYTKQNEKLINSIKAYSSFKPIIFDKKQIDTDFKNKYQHILSQNRGGGYWLWKPYIIYHTLKNLKDNDILIYSDSNYYFTEEFEELYKDHLKKSDIVVWHNKPNEETNLMMTYCKPEVVYEYKIEDLVYNKSCIECWAGFIVIKKTDYSLKLIKEWLEMCCTKDHITDNIDVDTDYYSYYFKDHRHDQSLLSILLYKHNIETYSFPKKYLQNVRHPY
jgi:hypothetical protein